MVSRAPAMRRPKKSMQRHAALVIGIALVLATGHVNAQEAPSPSPALTPTLVAAGQRVRLWERVGSNLSVPVVGSLVRLGADSVAIRPDGLNASVGLPRPEITRAEVSAGPRTGSRTTGMWTGAIVGALGGVVLGTIAGNAANRNAPRFAVAGFGVGIALGVGIGANVRGEAWRPAALPPVGSPPP